MYGWCIAGYLKNKIKKKIVSLRISSVSSIFQDILKQSSSQQKLFFPYKYKIQKIIKKCFFCSSHFLMLSRVAYLAQLYIFMNLFYPNIMRISILGTSYISLRYRHSFMLIGIHICIYMEYLYTKRQSCCSQREKESKVKETNTKHVELYTCMKVVSFGSRLAGTKERCIVYNIRQKKRAQHLKHLICCWC